MATIRQMYYDNIPESLATLAKVPGLYSMGYLNTRTLECLAKGDDPFPYLVLNVSCCYGVLSPTERVLNRLFREVILFDPKNDIICQNYSEGSILMRVKEYVITGNPLRALQLYLFYLCNQSN